MYRSVKLSIGGVAVAAMWVRDSGLAFKLGVSVSVGGLGFEIPVPAG